MKKNPSSKSVRVADTKSTVLDGRSRHRKHPGTGGHDTSPETWAALRAEYIRGDEPLTDIARRHGVLYSAAHNRRYGEKWDELRPPPPPAPPPLPFKATRWRQACPSCGWGSRIVPGGLNLLARTLTFECSGCGERFEQRLDERRSGPRQHRHRVVRPEADGIAAVIELFPRSPPC